METIKHAPTPNEIINDISNIAFKWPKETREMVFLAINSHYKTRELLRKMLAFSDARGVEKKRTLEESMLADEVSDFLAAEAEGR